MHTYVYVYIYIYIHVYLTIIYCAGGAPAPPPRRWENKQTIRDRISNTLSNQQHDLHSLTNNTSNCTTIYIYIYI